MYKINLTADEEVLIDLGILDISDIDWSRVRGSDSKRFNVTRIVPIIREWDAPHKAAEELGLCLSVNYTFSTKKTFLGSKDYLLIAINGFNYDQVLAKQHEPIQTLVDFACILNHDKLIDGIFNFFREKIDNYSNISIDSIHDRDHYGTLVKIPI